MHHGREGTDADDRGGTDDGADQRQVVALVREQSVGTLPTGEVGMNVKVPVTGGRR